MATLRDDVETIEEVIGEFFPDKDSRYTIVMNRQLFEAAIQQIIKIIEKQRL